MRALSYEEASAEDVARFAAMTPAERHIDVTTKVEGLAAFEALWQRRERGELLGERCAYSAFRVSGGGRAARR